MTVHEIDGSITQLAHELLAPHIQPGDVAIDATLGNGHDTLFLCQRVGKTGHVHGFDVQQQALETTRSRLSGYNNFTLHLRGHETMNQVVPPPCKVVVFNLGYLPGADKSLITDVETTITALNQALDLLEPTGRLSVMCYPGHPGGDIEAERVTGWMRAAEGEPQCYRRKNHKDSSPFLLHLVKSDS